MSPTTDNLQYYLRYTKGEKKLIDEHLPFYIDLDKGKRVPTTEKQKHFVRFCRGLEKANTPHEFAYLKYKRINSYEDKQKLKSIISNQSVKSKPIERKTQIKKFNSSSSRRTGRNQINKKNHDFNDAPASAHEIIQAQDKAMKIQASRRSNIRNAMAVDSDPRD
jgi:uncharacterized protein YifE (UPF0438 family)